MDKVNLLYLSRADVEAVNLPMRRIINAVEHALRLEGQGKVEMPPKPGIHPRPDAFIHAMPAYIRDTEAAGMKWVSGYPLNQKRGLPYINGLLILNDAATGIPLTVMDCTWITAMRTGAATAVAAKCLARPEARSLGILGAGVQGTANLLALNELFPLQEVRVYDVAADRVQQYIQQMSPQIKATIKAVTDPREAVAGMDLVVTAGPILRTPHATIKAGWLSKGSFASPVDFDSYWSSEALAQATRFCTDHTGQYQYYQKAGYFQHTPPLSADLGEILSGRKPGRQAAEETNICINLGLALEDIAVAPLVYAQAKERGIGQQLAL